MSTIPAKVIERIKDNLGRLQKVLDQAKQRDINEADTVVIVSDLLCYVFGFDKYSEITREYAIRNNFCDLAIKVDSEIKFLIEVKSIGTTLHDKHYQQALDYGANAGVEWIILTNGYIWKVYKVRFDKPIRTDFICEINMIDIKIKNQTDLDKLYILCKEGLKKNAIDEFTEHRMTVNKYYIGAIIQSDIISEAIRKELKKISNTIKVEETEISDIIRNDVIKRDLIESQEAIAANDSYNKILKKAAKDKAKNEGLKKTQDQTNEIT